MTFFSWITSTFFFFLCCLNLTNVLFNTNLPKLVLQFHWAINWFYIYITLYNNTCITHKWNLFTVQKFMSFKNTVFLKELLMLCFFILFWGFFYGFVLFGFFVCFWMLLLLLLFLLLFFLNWRGEKGPFSDNYLWKTPRITVFYVQVLSSRNGILRDQSKRRIMESS